MNPERYPNAETHLIYGDDLETTYSAEVVAELVGVSTKTVMYYQELGIVTPLEESDEFDAECLRHLSRIERLRVQHELTDSAVALVAGLLREIEHLRDERRCRLR